MEKYHVEGWELKGEGLKNFKGELEVDSDSLRNPYGRFLQGILDYGSDEIVPINIHMITSREGLISLLGLKIDVDNSLGHYAFDLRNDNPFLDSSFRGNYRGIVKGYSERVRFNFNPDNFKENISSKEALCLPMEMNLFFK